MVQDILLSMENDIQHIFPNVFEDPS